MHQLRALKRSAGEVFDRLAADPTTRINLGHERVHNDILSAAGGLDIMEEAGLVRQSGSLVVDLNCY